MILSFLRMILRRSIEFAVFYFKLKYLFAAFKRILTETTEYDGRSSTGQDRGDRLRPHGKHALIKKLN